MLTSLRIRNLAVIEDVTVPIGAGLTVLTGETGAGKSIVMDALALVIGARAQADLVRTAAEVATVEARFEVAPASPAAAILEDAGLAAPDGELLVRREITRAGRSRAFANDSPVTLGLLARLGDALVELHGQHEHQRLMEPAAQLELLDRLAGADALREEVAALRRRWEAASAERDRLAAEARAEARQEDLYRFQLDEIDAVAPRDGEEDELRAERRRLQHAGRIAAGLREVGALLHDDDDAAAARVGRAAGLLRELGALDPDLAGPLEDLEAAEVHLAEAVARVRTLRERAVEDPARLEAIDARLDALLRLKRKYGESAEAVRQYRARIAEALDRLTRHEEIARELDVRREAVAAEGRAAAARLTAARENAAGRLERAVQRELRELGMEHARLRLQLARERATGDELATAEGWRIGLRGAETAELALSANPGEALRPLAKVVSGGELSRVMLAVKTVLASADRMPTMVFDEVDAGIGGRVADAVGQRLARTAAGRQVLCVTHLATIAAHADHHLLVDKRVVRGVTRTTVTPLERAARVEELARMLGGERITETTRRHARELLTAAGR